MSELLGTKVLLATDGSEGAEGTGSALHVVYVEPLADFLKNGAGAPGYDHGLYEMIEAEGQETLRKLIWRVEVGGGTVAEAHLRTGAVADEIVALADQLEVDLIVVGSRGLRGIRRALAGSVSETIFRRARCSVMVVRAKGGNGPRWRGGHRAGEASGLPGDEPGGQRFNAAGEDVDGGATGNAFSSR